jgi:hypothetical protein
MPADVRQRYEKLQQNDLPGVTPGTDADEEDQDEDDGDGDDEEDNATQSTDTVCAPPCFQWCVIRTEAWTSITKA